MIGIKKVQVVPLDENYGKIIDSLNPATDDKTKNAPSINAVKNEFDNLGKIIDSLTTEDDRSKNTYSMNAIRTLVDNLRTSILNTISVVNTNVNAKVDKSNFAVLTGTLSSGSATISYPDEFTKDNCVVISTMLQHPTNPNYFWGNGSTFDSTGAINGCLPVRVRLGSDDINITSKIIGLTNNETSAVTDITTAYNYKIILMKIS